MKYLKEQIKLLIDTMDQFSISSITLFSIIGFYIWMTINALFIFQKKGTKIKIILESEKKTA